MNQKIIESLDNFVELLDERKKRKKRRKKRRKSKKRKVRTKPTPGETRYRAQKYSAPAKSKRAKGLARAAAAYRRGDVKAAARIRDRMEKRERKKKSFRNVPRADSMAEIKRLDRDALKELIEEIAQFEILENYMIEMDLLEDANEAILSERKKRRNRRKKKRKSSKKKKKGGGLSAAVKKSLDKKADRRCLTRGSVYSEFRKGLAAYLSSGSRKGMSAHQWAHARVNSANPSKSWATVKKRKVCPKKKKKK